MTLVLQGTALNEEPMTQPLIGRFDERGGTLGRSETATFTLPDPERLISRVQAQVLHREEGYWLENVSAANPILHNGRALSAGMRVLLRAGDELRIGGYTLVAAFEDDLESATILRGRTMTTSIQTDRRAERAAAAGAAAPAAAAAPAGAATADAARDAQPASRDELPWVEFLEGAGLDSAATASPSPESLRAVGAMLRIAVDGIQRLVAMRALAKDEMQARKTMIQVRGNNPLKFAPDATMALQMLLQPPVRGFLDGPAALRDALIDLQSHQVGVIAGMRSALDGVLERFNPGSMESLLATRSLFDSLLPAHRKSRLWELYLEHYHSLREEAREDFQRFFGEAFRAAYEAQVRNLEATPAAGTRIDGGPR